MTSYERVAKPTATVAPPQSSPVAKPLQRWPHPTGFSLGSESQAAINAQHPDRAEPGDSELADTELQRLPNPGFNLSQLRRTPASGPIQIHAGRIQPQPLVQAKCAECAQEDEEQVQPKLQRQPVGGADPPPANPGDQPQPMGPNVGAGGSSTTFTLVNTTRVVILIKG